MALPRRLLRTFIIARDVWTVTGQRHLGLISAGVAFYAFFAIFPALSATIALWGYFSDPQVVLSYLTTTHGLIPDDAYELIKTQITSLLSANLSTLGWTSFVSLIVALYASRAGVEALLAGLNALHGCPPRRGVLSFALASLFTLAGIALMVTALALVVGISVAVNFLDLVPGLEHFVTTSTPFLVMFLVVMVALGALYRYGPSCAWGRQSWLTWGAVWAAGSWALASYAFTAYLSNFGTYNRIYGSIGAVVALLMWLYISAYAVLAGAAINAEMPRRRRR